MVMVLVPVDDDNVDDLLDQHADTQEATDRMLTILREQNKIQAVHTELLRGLDENVGQRAKAKDRMIYALLALLGGVLYAVGLFEPVDIPFLAEVLLP